MARAVFTILPSLTLCVTVTVTVVGCLRKPPAGSANNASTLSHRAELTPHPAPAMPGVNVPDIKVDTVGYPPDWAKVAIFNVDPAGGAIVDANGKTVFNLADKNIRSFGKDQASGDQVWQVDFSELTAPGRYTLEVRDKKSDPFEISPSVYAKTLVASIKYFYFQRCRTPLVAPYAVWEGDSFTRAGACHQHDNVAWDLTEHPAQKTRWKPEAGWHDAGNFEMYVPSTAPTAQALLMAYEAHPELFADKHLNIPESGNSIPDLLDEAKWGLLWVLSMQDPSGGFRNREAVMGWGTPGPADRDLAAHWISGIGTASTGKACSVLAVASRVYRPWDAAFADRCEQAARRAWSFLEQHPERIVVDGHGSGQPLWDDGADYKKETGSRLLAAAEMWRTFREPTALEHVKALLADPQTRAEEFVRGAWVNMSRWGLMTLAADPDTPDEVRQESAKRLRTIALSLADIAGADGYRVASTLSDYYWGSNSNLMERTHLMLVANRLEPSPRLAETAKDQWHWLLGRNPNGYSMVTRVGKAPTRMYHLEWGRMDQMPPGALVGGPNSKEGGFLAPGTPAKALLWDNPEPISCAIQIPAHAMWHGEHEALVAGGFVRKDDWSVGWWAVTEGDIYYNANLVLVATEMAAGQARAEAGMPM